MKWLGLLSQTDDNDAIFNEIVYELFDSQEDMDNSVATIKKISQLLTANTALLDSSTKELNDYMKSSKKKMMDVYIPTVIDDEIILKAVDPKVETIIDNINKSRLYSEKLYIWMNSPYVFTEEDIKAIPEIKDLYFTQKRDVYSIPFATSTTWNKLGVSKKMRRQFTVALAMTKISEEIV